MSPSASTRGMTSAMPGGHRPEAGLHLGRQERPALGGRCLAVHHDVPEERLVVPADAHEVRWRRPRVGLVVQAGHRVAEPTQVDRAGRLLMDAPVHPAQHRADPGLTGRGRLDGGCAVAGRERLRNEQIGVRPDGPQPSDLGADGGRGVDVPTVPLPPVHADEVPAGRTVVPERRVLSVGDERESAVRQAE